MDSNRGKKVLVIHNPVSGVGNPELLERLVQREIESMGWKSDYHRTTSDENLSELVNQIKDGYDLVIAAGGDGTISGVAAGLANSSIPLGILPSGTWNAIARHLLIPLNLNRALALILGEHQLTTLDLMQVGTRTHAMNLTIGFSVAMIQNTGRQEKRRFGVFAYFGNVISQLFGLKLKRYNLVVDGVPYKVRASEIVVANYGLIGLRHLEELLEIHPDDGKADVFVVRARTILDFPDLVWRVFIKREKQTPIVRIFPGCEEIRISSTSPAVVQADGDIIGSTPVEIKVIPRCVQVIIPAPRKGILPEIEFLNPLFHPPER
jgi:YegS/Rv2252/BmrU family lipid kinase